MTNEKAKKILTVYAEHLRRQVQTRADLLLIVAVLADLLSVGFNINDLLSSESTDLRDRIREAANHPHINQLGKAVRLLTKL